MTLSLLSITVAFAGRYTDFVHQARTGADPGARTVSDGMAPPAKKGPARSRSGPRDLQQAQKMVRAVSSSKK